MNDRRLAIGGKRVPRRVSLRQLAGLSTSGDSIIAYRLSPIVTVSSFAGREVAAAPITMLLTLACAAGTLVLPMLQFQRFSEDGRLPRDCGLAGTVLFGLLLALGGAGRLYQALRGGTCALAFVKPLSRGTWLAGQLGGQLLGLGLFLATQAPALLIAEAAAPRYHTTGRFADIPTILAALGALVGAVALAAAANRVRSARFALSANLLMPCALWAFVLLRSFDGPLHWGTLSALPALFALLAQAAAVALALATALPPGLTAALTVLAVGLDLVFLGGSAYLPFDALSSAAAGSVAPTTLLLLLPQPLCLALLCLHLGARRLARSSV